MNSSEVISLSPLHSWHSCCNALAIAERPTEGLLDCRLRPDFVLPAQYYGRFRPAFATGGEGRLLLVVLQDAIDCYILNMNRGSRKAAIQFCEVRDWFNARNHRDLFAFETICGVFGFDPGRIRNALGTLRDEANIMHQEIFSRASTKSRLKRPRQARHNQQAKDRLTGNLPPKKVEIREGQSSEADYGARVVAKEPLCRGTLIFTISGRPAIQSHRSVQVAHATHIEDPSLLAYMNHSCRPNTILDTARRIVLALRDVSVGEELTFFYPSTEWQMVRPFRCLCGSQECIGLVAGAKYLSRDTLARYSISEHIRRLLCLPYQIEPSTP